MDFLALFDRSSESRPKAGAYAERNRMLSEAAYAPARALTQRPVQVGQIRPGDG